MTDQDTPTSCDCKYCPPQRDKDGAQICSCNKLTRVFCWFTTVGAKEICRHYEPRKEKA